MHQRVCLHQVAFLQDSTADFIAHCRDLGMPHMTLACPLVLRDGGLAALQRALTTTNPQVAVINHGIASFSDLERAGPEETEALHNAIGIAGTVGAKSIYLVSGGRGSLGWEDAAQRFCDIVSPCLPAAKERGVQLLVETASDFNVDIHIAHTLDDTIRLAAMAGIGVCLEMHAWWFEAGLKEKLARAMPVTGLVQVSDYVAGDRTAPCRAVPGDGMIPIEKIVGDILDLGYEGIFDLELIGPRIQQEGPREASKRAAEYLSELLTTLGA